MGETLGLGHSPHWTVFVVRPQCQPAWASQHPPLPPSLCFAHIFALHLRRSGATGQPWVTARERAGQTERQTDGQTDGQGARGPPASLPARRAWHKDARGKAHLGSPHPSPAYPGLPTHVVPTRVALTVRRHGPSRGCGVTAWCWGDSRCRARPAARSSSPARPPATGPARSPTAARPRRASRSLQGGTPASAGTQSQGTLLRFPPQAPFSHPLGSPNEAHSLETRLGTHRPGGPIHLQAAFPIC